MSFCLFQYRYGIGCGRSVSDKFRAVQLMPEDIFEDMQNTPPEAGRPKTATGYVDVFSNHGKNKKGYLSNER